MGYDELLRGNPNAFMICFDDIDYDELWYTASIENDNRTIFLVIG
jgi:hypothetical protein